MIRIGIMRPVQSVAMLPDNFDVSKLPRVFESRVLPAAAVLSLLLLHATALAQAEHLVRSGQTLASIAKQYGVRISNLAAANGIDERNRLREGQRLNVPDPGVIYVGRGQTLSSIASAYNVSLEDLARANHLRPDATLRIGKQLVLPGHRQQAQARARWGRPRHPGVATLIRSGTDKRIRVRLVDRRGQARPRALRVLRDLMRERQSNQRLRPHPRLVEHLARVSDHFGGRPIRVISGYRRAGGYTQETSRHTQGRAIDFRVLGVSNTEVRDFCRTLGSVGVGYYPRSTFVHLDVRRRPALWVDWSRPGEAPIYGRLGEGPPKKAPTSDEDESAPTAAAAPDSDAEAEAETDPDAPTS